MGAFCALSGIILGGVLGATAGGTAGMKIGNKIEQNASEKEIQDLRWACEQLGIPFPDDPDDPSSDWEVRAEQSFHDLPEEEKEEFREWMKEKLGLAV